MKHNKIWLIANKSEVGGGESFQIDVAQGLKAKGWLPLLLIPDAGRLSKLADKNNISYKTKWFKNPFEQSFFDLIYLSVALFFRMLFNKPSIIYANSTIASRVFMLGAKILNIPVICHIHCTDPDNVEVNAQWEYRHLPAPQKLIYVSEHNKKEYQKAYQTLYPKLKQVVIHNGVEDKVKITEQPKDDKIKIGYVANFEEIKGHEDLILAAKILKEEKQSFEIHLYGDDLRDENRKQILNDLLEKHSLTNHFVLHGFVSNVFSHISQLNIYVCASRQEAFPLSILEAMSVPLAIVSTDVGGIPEMISNNINGLLVPAHSPKSIAKNLSELIQDRKLQQKLAGNAREVFIEHFTNTQMINKIHVELELCL